MGSRPNPFVHFRKSLGDAEELQDAAPQVVTRSWDGKAAKALFDDGSLVSADFYQDGPSGFIMATWLDGSTLELDLANGRCNNGMLVGGAASSGVIQKRPAAAETVVDGVDVEVCDDDDDDDDDDDPPTTPKASLKLKAGHGNSHTIIARGATSVDKAQLLVVTGNQCDGTGWTPYWLCGSVKAELEKVCMHHLVLPIIGCEGLATVRSKAKELRSELLARQPTEERT